MRQDDSHLMRFYDGWNRYQELLVEAISPLTAEQLAIRAAPQLRQIWELAGHIIAARVYWFHQVMREGNDDLKPMQSWDDEGMPQRSTGDLVRGLNETWAMIEECLQRWTSNDLDVLKTTRSGSERSRQWIIWHVLEHDLHHGGELCFTLGMSGLPTPDL